MPSQSDSTGLHAVAQVGQMCISEMSQLQQDLMRIGVPMPAPGDWKPITAMTEAQLRYMGPEFTQQIVEARNEEALARKPSTFDTMTKAEIASLFLKVGRGEVKLSKDQLYEIFYGATKGS